MSKGKQSLLSREEKRFKDYLIRTGFKITPGRILICHLAMSLHGHFTTEELIKLCRKNRNKVSRATIYRSIRELLEAGIIRKTAFGEKHEHYEHVYDEILHHHARCIRCYAVIEFFCKQCDLNYIPILKSKNFKVLGHEMHFYGVCAKCQKLKEKALSPGENYARSYFK